MLSLAQVVRNFIIRIHFRITRTGIEDPAGKIKQLTRL